MKIMGRSFLPLVFSALVLLDGAAADEVATPADPAAAKRARVLELKAQTKVLRQGADAAYQIEGAECRQTLLVNNCLSGAANRRLEKVEQARALEGEINVLERELRRTELTERRAERARRLAERRPPATVSVEGVRSTTLAPPAVPAAATRNTAKDKAPRAVEKTD